MARHKTARRPTPRDKPSAPPAPRERRPLSPWTIPAALAGLHLALALLAFNPSPHIGGDNAIYVSLARSLLERGDYVELWDPALKPHTQYPPVYPAILAAAFALGVRPWIGVKLIVLVFSVAAVALSYLWMRRRTTPGVALAGGLFLAVAPGVLEHSHLELSDVPFWAFTMLALWGFAHLEGGSPGEPGAAEAPPGTRGGGAGTDPAAPAGDADGRRARLWAAVAVLGTVLAYFTRSAGLPLVVAAVAWLALARRWRSLAAMAAAVGVPAFFWWLRGRANGAAGYTSFLWYVDPYNPAAGRVGAAGFAARILDNLDRYFTEHVPVVLFENTWTPLVFLAVTFLLWALLGWARRLRRPGVPELFFPLYAGLVLVWPAVWSGERFLLPLLPLAVLYAAEATRDIAAELRRPRLLGGVAAAALFVPALWGASGRAVRGAECRTAYRYETHFPCMYEVWSDLFTLYEQMRGALPAGSVVISRKPTLQYVISGYRGRVYPLSADPDTFFQAMRRAGARWVVVDQSHDIAPVYLHPVLARHNADFCLVRGFFLPQAVLLYHTPGGPPPPPGTAGTTSFRVCPFGGAGAGNATGAP